MRRASLAEAKASLEGLIDEAARQHQPILILQHGRPAAARKDPSEEEIQALFAGLGASSTDVSAVEDLLSGRR